MAHVPNDTWLTPLVPSDSDKQCRSCLRAPASLGVCMQGKHQHLLKASGEYKQRSLPSRDKEGRGANEHISTEDGLE